MILDTKVEKKDEGILEVSCKVSKDYIDKIMQSVIIDIQSKTTIKGFRQGKAPLNMITKVYEGQIKYDTLNKILPEVYEKIIKEQKIDPITMPEFSGYEDIKKGVDLDFSFTIETKPELEELGNLEEVSIEKTEFEYKLQDIVDKEVDMLKNSFASYEDLAKEEIVEGDFVKATYTVLDEKGEGEVKSSFFLINDKDPQYVISQNYVGKKIGAEAEIEVEFPESYVDSSLVNQKRKVKFKLEEGKRVKYPEMGDEFAKKHNHENAEQMIKLVEENVEKQIKEEELLINADKVYNVLIEKSTFSISPSVITQQAQTKMTQMMNQMMSQGQSIEKYLEKEGLDQQGFIDKMKEQTYEDVKKFLIIERIAKDNDIKVDDKEVNEYIKEFIKTQVVNQDKIDDYYKKNKEAKENLKSKLKSLEVASFVLDKVAISGTEKKNIGEE